MTKATVFFMVCSFIALSIFYYAGTKNTHGELNQTPVRDVNQIERRNTEQTQKDLQKQLTQLLDESYVFFARVDKAFVKKLANIPIKNETLFIRSGGGFAQHGLPSANIIFEEGHNIVVYEHCSSACAELLLPAAKKVVFHDSPLIGFHGNTLSKEALIKEEAGDNAIFCSAIMGLNTRIRQFYKKTGHNPDFWHTQYEHLIATSKTVKVHPYPVNQYFKDMVFNGKKLGDITECYSIDVVTKHSFWYPTSEQLKTGFGLKFEGDVCADDKNCYENKLDKLYPKGTSLAVGDTVYISKGPPQ